MKNPKMEGSNVIDCIPQTGDCPLKCAECFYNGGRFYRTLDEPLIPTIEECEGEIVRVNSGHDSNLQYKKVMEVTKNYKDKFYNTSIPNLRFNAPTVLTINGPDTDFKFIEPRNIVSNINEIMFVRFRVNIWNMWLCENAIKAWTPTFPLVLTDMRYYSKDSVKLPTYYKYGKHVLNEYWKLNDKGLQKIFKLLAYPNVFWCGNPFEITTLCAKCRICEHLYIQTKMRLKNVSKM